MILLSEHLKGFTRKSYFFRHEIASFYLRCAFGFISELELDAGLDDGLVTFATLLMLFKMAFE